MRMTNKIMQNNSLYNINQTKILEDKLNTQLGTQSKISRPSDDPVVAIRALRLRSSVTTISQYYEKNAPDASQWLTVTADALSKVTDVVTDLYKQAEKASDEELTADDLAVILDQMRELTGEVYSTGNADYAGRYIFTGYRTDTELTFKEDMTKQIDISEPMKTSQIGSFGYTDYNKLQTAEGLAASTELDVTNGTVYRLRLAYDSLDDTMANLVFSADTEIDGLTFVDIKDADDNVIGRKLAGVTMVDDPETAYKEAIAKEDDTNPSVSFVPETGEIVLNKAAYSKLQKYLEDGGKMTVEYSRSEWRKDELNPLHYFDCVEHNIIMQDGVEKETTIRYNEGGETDTQITYDVGFNQQIQVNTNANEVFYHAFQRDIDDLTIAMDHLQELADLQKQVKTMRDKYDEETQEYQDYQVQLDAVNKAYSYVREEVQSMMEGQMTKYQNYLDGVNLAITKNGTRGSRLDLISERLSNQRSTFKELQEENEGIEMTEVAVKLSSAELTYEAALAATGKIVQTSLMNYI